MSQCHVLFALCNQMAKVINQELEQNFAASSFPDLRIIAEPGRYFSGPGITLVLNVIARRCIRNKATEETHSQLEYRYYLNDGWHGSLLYFSRPMRKFELVPSCLKVRTCVGGNNWTLNMVLVLQEYISQNSWFQTYQIITKTSINIICTYFNFNVCPWMLPNIC